MPSKKPTRKEQAAQSKALLVDIALELFVDQGYDATSVGQILERADMARGALYHHFPDGKKGLFLEVVHVVDHQLHEAFDTIVTTIESPTEQILAGFDELLRLAADRNFARIILIEAATVMPGAWAEGSEFQLLRALLEQGMQQGELKTVPLDEAASSLYGAARRSADFVARSTDPATAATNSSIVLKALINGLR